MTPERARLIETLYAEALERKAAERTTFLSMACGEDRELFREIESLLAQGTNPESFMESPAIAEVLPRTTPTRECSACSASIAAESRFCSSCGQSTDHASVPTAGAPPTSPIDALPAQPGVVSTFLMFPMTFKFSAWYFKVGLIAMAWVAAFAIFGFFVSVQGQRLLDIEGVEKPS